MPIANIDHVESLTGEEDHGVIRSLTRKVRVTFTDTDNPPKSFDILAAALDACPQPFTTPPKKAFSATVNNPTFAQQSSIKLVDDRFGSLILTKRTPTVVDRDKYVVDVILHYEHILDGPHQQIFNPPSGILFGKGKTSVVDKSTNFYYPFGDPGNGRQTIQVAYTYPEWETGIAGVPFDKNFPRTIFQGGEISIPFPQSNFSMMGWAEGITDPQGTADKFAPTVNKVTWLGKPPFTWMCAECKWECIEYSKKRYRFDFEFQYNVDTWDPLVVFLDHRTGRPPAGVKDQAGAIADNALFVQFGIFVVSRASNPINDANQPGAMWQVPVLRRLDFNKEFGAYFNGATPPRVD